VLPRIFSGFFALLFFIFAIVQVNDPDPFAWIIIYGTVSVVSGFGVWNRYHFSVLIMGMVVCFGGAAYLFPGVIEWFTEHNTDEIFQEMSPDKVFIETARECFGLTVAFLVFLFHFIRAKQLERQHKIRA